MNFDIALIVLRVYQIKKCTQHEDMGLGTAADAGFVEGGSVILLRAKHTQNFGGHAHFWLNHTSFRLL